MRIIEIFHSLQGEGPKTGLRTSFIRTARCNLRCSWCDTTYSFGAGVERTLASILEEVKGHGTRHVCLTGGEPLLQSESVRLVGELSRRRYTIVIETGGSLDVGPYLSFARTCISLDVKCPSSHMEKRMHWDNLPKLRRTDVIKFVVADRRDYDYAKRVMHEHPSKAEVVIQPVWGVPPGPIADWVLEDRLEARLMLQEHKVLWGEVPGR